MAASTVPFRNVAKRPKSGPNGVFPQSPGHIGLGSYKKFGRACMISCMHAYRLNHTGKSSLREVYHDHENHEYDHENDLETFRVVKVHKIHHPRHIATSCQTFKTTFRVKMGAGGCLFLKNHVI